MPEPTYLLNEDCEITSDLKRRVLEELSGETELDEAIVDALVRGIISLLESP
jgi:hypothetical protein